MSGGGIHTKPAGPHLLQELPQIRFVHVVAVFIALEG
jgi:hypothetical protein